MAARERVAHARPLTCLTRASTRSRSRGRLLSQPGRGRISRRLRWVGGPLVRTAVAIAIFCDRFARALLCLLWRSCTRSRLRIPSSHRPGRGLHRRPPMGAGGGRHSRRAAPHVCTAVAIAIFLTVSRARSCPCCGARAHSHARSFLPCIGRGDYCTDTRRRGRRGSAAAGVPHRLCVQRGEERRGEERGEDGRGGEGREDARRGEGRRKERRGEARR